MFIDNSFHNNGLDTEPFSDLGLGKITGKLSDNGKFKTPTLRNIEAFWFVLRTMVDLVA